MRIKYKTLEERESLISQHTTGGFVLIKDERITEGMFLTFEKPIPTIEERITMLEQIENDRLMGGLLG